MRGQLLLNLVVSLALYQEVMYRKKGRT
jgi:hypothetical protein